MQTRQERLQRIIHDIRLNPSQKDVGPVLDRLETMLNRGEFEESEVRQIIINLPVTTQFTILNFLYVKSTSS